MPFTTLLCDASWQTTASRERKQVQQAIRRRVQWEGTYHKIKHKRSNRANAHVACSAVQCSAVRGPRPTASLCQPSWCIEWYISLCKRRHFHVTNKRDQLTGFILTQQGWFGLRSRRKDRESWLVAIILFAVSNGSLRCTLELYDENRQNPDLTSPPLSRGVFYVKILMVVLLNDNGGQQQETVTTKGPDGVVGASACLTHMSRK